MVYLNEQTARVLERISQHLPHALLLSGPNGVGLSTAARHAIGASKAQILEVFPEKDEKIDIEKGTITVEVIRRLYTQLRTIAPKGRVVVIDYAERIAIPAQNAFLKLLEEPIEGTHFILLSHAPELLLPTIRSRVQHIDVRPISRGQSESLLADNGVTDPTHRAQLLFIAEGLPAELTRLVRDEPYFNTRAVVVKDARELITGSAYQRLLLAKKYKDNRADALMLLSDSMRQLQHTLAGGGSPDSLLILDRFEKVYKRILEQGNVRLQLSSLVVLQ